MNNNYRIYESSLYRKNEKSLDQYDSRFKRNLSKTGGRVDTSIQQITSNDLYGSKYKTSTLSKINKYGYITDIDPRATFMDKKGNISKKFFRAQDLYIVPTSNQGTGDKTFYSSISKKSYTTHVRNFAQRGGPIRLPNLPHAKGIGRSFSSDSVLGYIQCRTINNKIANDGLVYLASSPQNIQDSTSVEMASETTIGASQGFNLFSSVGTRQLSFSFDVYADYLPAPFNNVKEYCLALKQMNYPTYSGMRVNSPDVIFSYGGIRIRGIPQISCTYETTVKKGIVDKASVSVQITETEPIINGSARI